MCGIAGLMLASGAAPPEDTLAGLAAALAHRGPDGVGYYRSGGLAMVHARLAIIDLATGDQPLYEPGGAALIGNGEIYNYLELTAALPDVTFATKSDCELPLHLYRRHGLDFVRFLRGMYALAIHDPAEDLLILSRDPFGIKPLYYCDGAWGVAFASEPEALIKAGLARAELCVPARNELLQLQFSTGRDSIFAGIKRVLPGETLAIRNGRIVERRRIDALPEGAPLKLNEAEALERLDAAWRDSVLVHQRSDVAYGMFLSGGIDSTAVLAMMAQLNDRPVTAFTIGFSNSQSADERPAAEAAAQAVGAEHVKLDFREGDFWHLLPAIAEAMDDPAADYAILPTWKLAAAARERGIKVILSGEGGDELFGGYGRYRSATRPWWAGGKVMRSSGSLDRLRLLRRELIGWRDGIASAEIQASLAGRSRLQIAQAVDCADWLPNDLLTKLDRCLMAHGVEGRTPFLDPVMADLAFRLPDELKIRKRMGKYLLRRWLGGALPASQPLARKKGFTVPVGEWIAKRGSLLGPLVARQPGIEEICQPGAVERLFANINGKHAGFAAWTLLFYALWHRAHIERLPSERDVFQTLGG